MKSLTPRQQITLQNLTRSNIVSDSDIIAWAKIKLNQPGKRQRTRRHHPTAGTRKHPVKYYQQIIDYIKETKSDQM